MVTVGGIQQFTIDASKNNSKASLLKTNISIKTGDLLIVNVSSGNPYGTYQGTHKFEDFYKTDISSPNYDFTLASLVGTLDGGITFLPVANKLEMTVLQQDGNLSFVFWGNDKSANGNSVTLTVDVKKQSDLQYLNGSVAVDSSVFQDKGLFQIDAYINSVSRNTPDTLFQTGIYVEPGDLLNVDVSPVDFWALYTNNVDGGNDINCTLNANGRKVDGSVYGNLALFQHTFLYGSLVGSIDGGKSFFPVGTHLVMTVYTAGKLSFGCWDVDYASNAGFIKAYVKVVRNGITITQASNHTNFNQFTNVAGLSTKAKFDPNTCIWAKANCKLSPSLVDKSQGIIVTDPDKKYKVQITVDPGTASYKNTFGLFPVSADGSVAGVKPGDANYAETAVRNRVKLPDYNEQSIKQTFASELIGGSNYEVFLISNGTPDQFLQIDPKNLTKEPPKAYFRTTQANPDKISHVKALSEDTFGFEDIYGGGDQNFNDLIVQLKVTSIESTSTSSSTPAQTNTTLTEKDCPLYPLCKLSQLNN